MSRLQQLNPASSAAFRRVEKQTVTDDLDSQMREAILAGRLKPGETLAEAQLATQSGGKKTTLSQTYEKDHSCFDRVSDSDECRWLCR
jgi:hypothetical protein